MMKLRRLLRPFSLSELQSALLWLRQEEISEWQRIALEANRSSRDLAVAFRIAVEKPEIDIREDLDKLIRDLSDQVAKMEEQIV